MTYFKLIENLQKLDEEQKGKQALYLGYDNEYYLLEDITVVRENQPVLTTEYESTKNY